MKIIISCLLLAISSSIVAFTHVEVNQNTSSSDEQVVSILSAEAIHFFNKNAGEDHFLVLVFDADIKQTVPELNEYVKLMKQLEVSFFAFHFGDDSSYSLITHNIKNGYFENYNLADIAEDGMEFVFEDFTMNSLSLVDLNSNEVIYTSPVQTSKTTGGNKESILKRALATIH